MGAQADGSKIQMLQQAISERQNELQRVADILAKAAQKFRRIAAWIRVLLILCGAMAATQSAWDQAFSGYKEHSFLVFTVLGVLITTLAGLEAAFKFEGKGTELNLLAASCHSAVRKTDACWYKQVGIAPTQEERIAGAMSLIELQDVRLSEIQERAAGCGVNITLEVRRDYQGLEAPYSEETPQVPTHPYQA